LNVIHTSIISPTSQGITTTSANTRLVKKGKELETKKRKISSIVVQENEIQGVKR